MQIWINRGGTDVGFSAHAYTISANSAYEEVNWNFNIDVAANSYIKIRYAADDLDLKFDSTAASAPYPGISSVVMAVNYISSTRGFTIATLP